MQGRSECSARASLDCFVLVSSSRECWIAAGGVCSMESHSCAPRDRTSTEARRQRTGDDHTRSGLAAPHPRTALNLSTQLCRTALLLRCRCCTHTASVKEDCGTGTRSQDTDFFGRSVIGATGRHRSRQARTDWRSRCRCRSRRRLCPAPVDAALSVLSPRRDGSSPSPCPRLALCVAVPMLLHPCDMRPCDLVSDGTSRSSTDSALSPLTAVTLVAEAGTRTEANATSQPISSACSQTLRPRVAAWAKLCPSTFQASCMHRAVGSDWMDHCLLMARHLRSCGSIIVLRDCGSGLWGTGPRPSRPATARAWFLPRRTTRESDRTRLASWTRMDRFGSWEVRAAEAWEPICGSSTPPAGHGLGWPACRLQAWRQFTAWGGRVAPGLFFSSVSQCLYIFGGSLPTANTLKNDLWRYCPRTDAIAWLGDRRGATRWRGLRLYILPRLMVSLIRAICPTLVSASATRLMQFVGLCSSSAVTPTQPQSPCSLATTSGPSTPARCSGLGSVGPRPSPHTIPRVLARSACHRPAMLDDSMRRRRSIRCLDASTCMAVCVRAVTP